MSAAWLFAGRLLTPPADAPGPDEPLRFSWDAPDECPTEAAVRARIDRLLGADLAHPIRTPVQARATVTELRAARWTLSMELETESGLSRTELSAARCDLLAQAAVLKVAMAVDPLRVAESIEAEEATPPPTASAPPPEARPPPAAATATAAATAEADDGSDATPGALPARSPDRLPRAILRADGLFDYGVLPGAGFGVALTAGVALDPWRFEAVGSFWTPRAATLPGEPQVGGRFVLGAVTLRGCGVPRARALEFPICLGFETGAMRARGFGVEDPTVSHRLWAAGQLGAGLAWAPTPRLALRFEAQVVVAAARPAFQIVDAGLIHRAAPAAPRAAVGLEVRLP